MGKNRELAEAYLHYFCTGDIDGLAALLAPELTVTGPLLESHSAAEYLKALREDPPEKAHCKILNITEDDESAAMFYEYVKSGQLAIIAQHFSVSDGRIHAIRVVFDARDLM